MVSLRFGENPGRHHQYFKSRIFTDYPDPFRPKWKCGVVHHVVLPIQWLRLDAITPIDRHAGCHAGG